MRQRLVDRQVRFQFRDQSIAALADQGGGQSIEPGAAARLDQRLVEQVALRVAAAEAVRAVADRPKQLDALGTVDNSQIGNSQIKVDPDGSATVVLWPRSASQDQVAAITVAVVTHAEHRRRQAAPETRAFAPGSQLFASRWVAAGRAHQKRPWR